MRRDGLKLEEKYEIDIGYSEEDGCFVARIPQLPFTGAHGGSFEEALAGARDAIEVTVEVARELGKPLPEPLGLTVS
jgi:predicted RNase H-like HicB family nuclease